VRDDVETRSETIKDVADCKELGLVIKSHVFYAKCTSPDSTLGYNTTHDLVVPTPQLKIVSM
jgi:hypothetical protein